MQKKGGKKITIKNTRWKKYFFHDFFGSLEKNGELLNCSQKKRSLWKKGSFENSEKRELGKKEL